MNKEMIISSNGHETRVAILEDDQLAELFVEREQNRGVVGNVYKGRVSKVLPGMQSSFVDIGLERDGFLYVSDVIANLDEYFIKTAAAPKWFQIREKAARAKAVKGNQKLGTSTSDQAFNARGMRRSSTGTKR